MFYLLLLAPLVHSQFNPNLISGLCVDTASGCETQPGLCGMPEIARTYCMKTCRLCSGLPASSPPPYPSVFPNPGGFAQSTQQVPFPQQQINPKFVATQEPSSGQTIVTSGGNWNQNFNGLDFPETGDEAGANRA